MSTCACGRPVEDAFVCQGCANRLEVDLGDIPALAGELDLVIGRQTRYVERVGSRSSETPAFINERASNLRFALQNTLATWCRLVDEERLVPGQDLPPHDDMPSMAALAAYLLHAVEAIRHHVAGPEACDEIGEAVRQVRHVIDAPANRTTFGVGPCPEEPCLGEVRAYFPADETKRPSMSCTVEPNHRWEPEQWGHVGRRILRRKESLTRQRQQSGPTSAPERSADGSLVAS